MKKLIAICCVTFLYGCGGSSGSSTPAAVKVSIARTPAQLKWTDADTYCKTITISGKTGWRLPTQGELAAYAQGGTDSGGGAVWTSQVANPSYHYYISLNAMTGEATAASDTNLFYVRCAHD